jgi:hypothetical protein
MASKQALAKNLLYQIEGMPTVKEDSILSQSDGGQIQNIQTAPQL